MSTSVASERPTISNRSRSRSASLDQKRARKLRQIERRKHDRDREGTRLGAEERLLKVRIERGDLLVGRLLRQFGVRPEPLLGTVFWLFRIHEPVVLA